MKKREFLSLTLAEVVALLRHREKIRHRENDIPPARLAAIVLNMFRNEEDNPEPFTVLDVLPFLENKKTLTLEEQQQEHAAAQLLKVRMMTIRFGGEIALDPDAIDSP